MSESRGDTPNDRFGTRPRIARAHGQQSSPEQHRQSDQFGPTQAIPTQKMSPPSQRPLVARRSTRRWNIGRDVAAAVLLLIALFLPWNLYFGGAIPNGHGGVFALLIAATVLSLGSIVVTYAGPWRLFGSRFNPVMVGRLRAWLNAPYGLLVFGVVVFEVVQTVRYGGSANVPSGVGPGAWLGIAGSLLSAQPLITGTATDDEKFRRWLQSTRIVGYASIVLASLSFLLNLFWRVKSALPSAGSGFGKQNVAIIATAVIYGVVALVAVVVASRWILRRSRVSRLAIIALGASTLVAGLIVWSLPIGRDIDGFHGIAQNTSTAGVGFEGYLAWAAAAAIFGPLMLIMTMTPQQADVWRAAARKGLLLIVVWSVGSVVMRVTDLVVSLSLKLPYSPYNSAAMAAFDLVTAVLAVWLYINVLNRALPAVLISSACAVLLVLTISRIVVGIALAPRVAGTSGWAANPVYGNNLAQQITSTFDVVLCLLAVCILVVVIVTGRSLPTTSRPSSTPPPASDAATTRLATGETETTRLAAGSPEHPAPKPRIHRPDSPQQASAAKPTIYRGQEDSGDSRRHRT